MIKFDSLADLVIFREVTNLKSRFSQNRILTISMKFKSKSLRTRTKRFDCHLFNNAGSDVIDREKKKNSLSCYKNTQFFSNTDFIQILAKEYAYLQVKENQGVIGKKRNHGRRH